MINLDTIKALPIRSFLEKQGITPVIDKGYYGLYRSPYRVDTVPSFKVDYCRNLWCDYGTGEGGSIIDLVMRLEKCSVGDAIRILEDTPDQIRIPTYLPPEDHPPALIITEIKPLAHPALVRYLKSRKHRKGPLPRNYLQGRRKGLFCGRISKRLRRVGIAKQGLQR